VVIDELDGIGLSCGEIWSVKAVATMLQRSVRTVQRWIKQKRLKAFHKGRCISGIGDNQLIQFLENREASELGYEI